MLINILTYLKTMSKLLDIPKFYGPLATIAFTVGYHLSAAYFGFSVSLAWLYLFLVAGSFIGGLRAGLLCAAWISLYAHYIGPDDWFLTIQRVTTSFATAALVGWQTQQLRRFYQREDAMYNGNAEKLEEALQFVREAKEELKAAEDQVRQGEDRLGNLLASVVGYKSLRKTIDDVQAWHADPENIKKLHEMQEAEDDDNG